LVKIESIFTTWKGNQKGIVGGIIKGQCQIKVVDQRKGVVIKIALELIVKIFSNKTKL